MINVQEMTDEEKEATAQKMNDMADFIMEFFKLNNIDPTLAMSGMITLLIRMLRCRKSNESEIKQLLDRIHIAIMRE